MKLRTGFVSNSSSSSFCIFGRYVTIDELFTKEEQEVEGFDAFGPPIEGKVASVGLEYSSIPDGDSVVIGLSPDAFRDDETGAQFKQRVIDGLTKLIGVDGAKASWQSESWYDG